MPFVKLDCGMLSSTIWDDFDGRTVFITALLMAEPREYQEPIPQIKVRSLDETGWSAPAGWYGFVPAAGSGIVRRAGGISMHDGMAALERLGEPEPESRSQEHSGRRMIRINGGYLILNYDRFRERDYTAAERQRRFRERKKQREEEPEGEPQQKTAAEDVTRNSDDETRDVTLPSRNITQAEAEAEAEATKSKSKSNVSGAFSAADFFDDVFWPLILETKVPEAIGRKKSRAHIIASVETQADADACIAARQSYASSKRVKDGFIQNATTWCNNWRDWIGYVDPPRNGSGRAQRDPETEKKIRDDFAPYRDAH